MYLATLLLLAVPFLHPQAATAPSGHWEGKIEIPHQEMGITVDLSRTPAGAWIGSMTILKSTSVDVPLDTLAVDGTAVRFAAALPGKTSFEGTLAADANSLSGKVSSSEGSVPFQLTRNGEANVKVPPPSSAMTKDLSERLSLPVLDSECADDGIRCSP